jgi:hypothetical protein
MTNDIAKRLENDIAKRLEKLQDDLNHLAEKLSGEGPSSYTERKERAKERQAFVSEIERMQNESE